MSAHHYPGSWSRRQGNKIQVTQSNSSFSIPLRIPRERAAIRMQKSLHVGTAPFRSPCSCHLARYNLTGRQLYSACLGWSFETHVVSLTARNAGSARHNGCMDSYKDASPSHIHQKFYLYLVSPSYWRSLTFFLQGSLDLVTSPPEHKDIQTELYSAGVPLIAEKIFYLLSPADLCNCVQVGKTWITIGLSLYSVCLAKFLSATCMV